MLRNLLVHVDGSPSSMMRTDLALSLASAHGARLTGLYVGEIPSSDKAGEEGHATWIAQTAARAEQLFRERTDGAIPPTQWKCANGRTPEIIAQMARRSDLVVIGQDVEQTAEPAIGSIARVVFDSGRPVLVVPARGEFPVIGHHVLVAWSGSRESARALNDALPILHSADRTVVLLVNPPDGTTDEDSAADVSEQISAHGINAVILRAFANRVDIGEAILRRAREAGADLVVMGARGALSAAEPTLGQTTRHVLSGMTLPVLISY
jgi:nucleotide-binding universal stress UspA family protein